MNRHQSRICAMKILYELDINSINNEEQLVDLDKALQQIPFVLDPDFVFGENQENDALMVEVLNKTEFARMLVTTVVTNLEKIDNTISKALVDWTIDRLSYVDRAIIRIAVAEMLYTDLAHHIIINEAIEITKEYSNLEDEAQSRFTNKLLDSISAGLK